MAEDAETEAFCGYGEVEDVLGLEGQNAGADLDSAQDHKHDASVHGKNIEIAFSRESFEAAQGLVARLDKIRCATE
jgi:hypothetical protein